MYVGTTARSKWELGIAFPAAYLAVWLISRGLSFLASPIEAPSLADDTTAWTLGANMLLEMHI